MTKRQSHPLLILFALWLMVFSASSQVIILSPILPRIGEALSIPEARLGWLITSYAVMLGIFALIIGPISDSTGRRRVLLAGSSAMALMLALHAVADTFFSLLVVRALAGAAGGLLSGGAVSYVGDYFPYERRGWANGWVMSGVAVGQIVGIPLGTLLADAFGFRAAFLMFAATMAMASALIYLFVPQPNVERSEEALSVRSSIRIYASLLRMPAARAATTAYFLMFFAIGLYIVYLPTWMEHELSVGGSAIASLFFVGGIANVISGPVAGRMSDTLGRKPLIVASCLGLGVLMLLTTVLIHGMPAAYLLFGLAMVMVGMRISPLQSLMSALVSADRRGALMSLAIAVGQVGIGIGGAAAGIAYTRFGYASSTMVAAAAMVVMAVVVHFGLPEPTGSR